MDPGWDCGTCRIFHQGDAFRVTADDHLTDEPAPGIGNHTGLTRTPKVHTASGIASFQGNNRFAGYDSMVLCHTLQEP